jgi:hypothetical protein
MTQSTLPAPALSETILLRLARELGMGILPLETILETSQIDQNTWETIQNHPRFLQLLESESTVWNSSLNTHERVKLKSAAMIEEWLPEAFNRLHSQTETLNAKTELGKLIRDLAGFTKQGVGMEATGEKFSVTINLGADSQLKFEKTSPKVIDGEAL